MPIVSRLTLYSPPFIKLVLTAFFWGGTWIAGRSAVQEMSPLAVASWRFLLATLVLGMLLWRREGFPRWSWRDWLVLSSLGLTGVFLYNLFFLYGLQYVEAGRGALVTAFTPAYIALADWLLFRAPMSPFKAFGIVLATGGCLLVVTQGQPARIFQGEVGFGECLLLGTSLSWAAYTLINRKISMRFSPLAMTFGACLTGWLFLTAYALADHSLFDFSAATWRASAGIVFLGMFGTAVAFTWYSEAVGHIGSTRASAFINLVPVFAVLQGTLLLDERLGAGVLVGGATVIAGVLITHCAGQKSA
ncbi:membrane protein [Betaproteobacteria bacterium]|nr:membrane protein [Betaproteobacteria bacterium]